MLKQDILNQKNKFGEQKLDPLRLMPNEIRRRVGKFTKKKGTFPKPDAVSAADAAVTLFDKKMALIKEYTG